MMALNKKLWEFRADQRSPQDKKNKLLGLQLAGWGISVCIDKFKESWRILRLQAEQGVGMGRAGNHGEPRDTDIWA